MANGTVAWGGYVFHVCDYDTDWKDAPGVYIFTGVNQKNNWIPVYIGETGSFSDRMAGHERWEQARRLGATHVHARVVQGDRQVRVGIQDELVQAYSPPLNR